MMKHRFTFSQIQAMPRPAGYLRELLAIATDQGEDWLELDLDSPGYWALKKKYQSSAHDVAGGRASSLSPGKRGCCI